jgi:hypothetical protein
MTVRNLRWLMPVTLILLMAAPALYADTIIMKDGTFHEGIIREIENGEVRVEIGGQLMTFDILAIESMNFDTPHLVSTGTDATMDHFLTSVDAQELVENFAELEETAAELRTMITQVRRYWEAKEPIESRERQAWEAARDQFRRPLSRYQELLNDVYFHTLSRVDEYNAIAHEAGDIYVGVKGLFNIGSPLLPEGMGELSLRKYVPASWFDTIYYEGYNIGYTDAYLKITGDYPEN